MRDENAEFKGLRDEVVGPKVECPEDVAHILARGQDENGCFALRADLAEDLEPLDARKPQVKDDDIRSIDLPPPECLRSIGGLHDDEAFAPQNIRGEIEHVGLVFDEQDLDHFYPRCVTVPHEGCRVPLKAAEQKHYEAGLDLTNVLQRAPDSADKNRCPRCDGPVTGDAPARGDW